jgi:hypothetical protein
MYIIEALNLEVVPRFFKNVWTLVVITKKDNRTKFLFLLELP